MRGSLYLAWRYLAFHPLKTAILVASVTLILTIPAALRVLVAQSERELTQRAEGTPLLIGAKGSPLELVLNSLYFSTEVPERLKYGQVDRVADTGFALPIPLYVRFRSHEDPIIGTSLDYLEFRGLKIAAGRRFAVMGECVLGARLAARRGIAPGGYVISSPESVFDLAGVYPLRMHVVGVLAYSGGPDDDAIFTDVRTTWTIEGLAHGHMDLSKPEAASQVLKKEGDVVVGNASVMQFNEITPDNIRSFHFHGDPADFPLTAVIAVPDSEKSGTLLRGRFMDPGELHQILRPNDVVQELLETVFTIQGFVVAALGLVSATPLTTMALVFSLSLRLRRREIETMVKIGGARLSIAAIVVSEILGVLLAGIVIAGFLTWLIAAFGSDVVRAIVR